MDDGSAMGLTRSTGQALVRQLVLQGVRRVACVPGESFLPVLDALRDTTIEITICRQEGGVAMMADAWGRATGSPGVCFVTRGPGAANALIGLHIAQQDSTPMILFAGQVDKGMEGREAWQELDLRRTFSGVAKAVLELEDPARVGELVSRAFHLAMAGRPGPVVVGMPRDVLSRLSHGGDAPPALAVEAGPDAQALSSLQDLLASARRPIAIVGGSRWDEASRSAIHRFAERHALPIVSSYRRGSLLDAEHPCYAGDLGLGPNPKLIDRIRGADLLLLLGGRLGEVPSQAYSLLPLPDPGAALVHVHADPDEIGRVYRPALGIPASPRRFAPALAELAPPAIIPWAGQADAAHADYMAWSGVATPQPGQLNLGEVMIWLRETLERTTIVCNGAGGYAAWLHRFYRFRELNAHVAPTAATLGYGPPAAVAMKRLYPARRIISLSGDGDFLMNGQEFATMVQYGLPIINLVIDNASYGSIRVAQERAFPGRRVATELRNPDFAAYARAFGGFGATVERTEDFAAAFRAAEASGLPAILHLKVDPECGTPAATLSQIGDQARAASVMA